MAEIAEPSSEWTELGIRAKWVKDWRRLRFSPELFGSLASAHPKYFGRGGAADIARARTLGKLGFTASQLEVLLGVDQEEGSDLVGYVLRRLTRKRPVTLDHLLWLMSDEPDERDKFCEEAGFVSSV